MTDQNQQASETVEQIKERYTLAKPCIVSGDEEATDPHTVWLKVNQQSFRIDGYQNTKEEADWLRRMMAKALLTFASEQPLIKEVEL